MIEFISTLIFLPIAAISICGYGTLVLPQSQSWSRRFGAGTLLMFFLVSAAGWSGLLVPALLWTILAIGTLLWVRPGRFSLPRGGFMIALCGLILFPLILLPPISRDAMIHHLYQARIWLEAGRIVRPDWSGIFSYPYLVESFYTVAGGTFGFRVSRAVSLLGFLAVCSVPAGYFLRKGRRKTAILCLIVVMSIPELVRNASWSYSDSFLVFFSLLAYVELIRKRGNPVLAVIWAGGASCCKYNGFIVLASVCILLPFFFRNMTRKVIFYSIFAAFFTTAWWALPNILQWGNPVYPLFQGIFGPVIPLSSRASEYYALNTFSTSLNGILDYLLLPVRISLHGEWNNPALFDGASGPLLLAGTILAVPIVRDRRRKFLLPFLYLIITLIANGAAVRVRYLLPGLAMLSIPVSETFESLLINRNKIMRAATLVLIAVCVIWSADKILNLYEHERPWEFQDDKTYLDENAPYYEFFRKCDRYISESDTTLMVNMNRPFYFPGYAVFDHKVVPFEFMKMLWSGMNSEDIVINLMERGITHLAVDMFITSINITPELSEDELEQWRDFVSFKLSPLLTVDRYILFELEPRPY
ncbi:MAG: hypothetical protein KAW14_03990 [Candidatus Aegiribacteria sp.]|nr:hypothetical protein [Candidatus Aegiribacteria sp.]